MEQIEKMKKEYTEQFDKSKDYRAKLLDEVKKTESTMEQLRGAFLALEALEQKLSAPAEIAPPEAPGAPALKVVSEPTAPIDEAQATPAN